MILSKLHINGKPFFKSRGEYRSLINPAKQSIEDGIELILTNKDYIKFRTLIKILPKPVKFSFYVKYEGMPRKNIPCKMIKLSRPSESEWRLSFDIRI